MFRTTLLVMALSLASWGALPVLAQSQDPLGRLLADFDRIDTDGDGVISRAEFREVRAARWAEIDRNGDGYLGEDDFPLWAARRARTRLAEIASLDADGDGRISRAEFLDGPAPLFTEADRNADGLLTRAEVEARAS